MTSAPPQRKSVKHITCFYWNRGGCRFSESECLYAHQRNTERVAEAPVHVERGQPAVAGRNARRLQPEYVPWRTLPALERQGSSTPRLESSQRLLPQQSLHWEQDFQRRTSRLQPFQQHPLPQRSSNLQFAQHQPSQVQQHTPPQQLLPEQPFHQQLPQQLPIRPQRVQELRSGILSQPFSNPSPLTTTPSTTVVGNRPGHAQQPIAITMDVEIRTFRELRANIERTIQGLVTMANNLLEQIRQLQIRLGFFGAVGPGMPAMELAGEINELVREYRVLTDQMDAISRRFPE